MISMGPEMCVHNLTMKVVARALTQKRTTEKALHKIRLMRKRNIIFVFFLFAISHFGRRKFEGDPMVEYEVNPNPKALTTSRQTS